MAGDIQAGADRPDADGDFCSHFGRQMPGGGIGEMVDKSDNPDEVAASRILPGNWR